MKGELVNKGSQSKFESLYCLSHTFLWCAELLSTAATIFSAKPVPHWHRLFDLNINQGRLMPPKLFFSFCLVLFSNVKRMYVKTIIVQFGEIPSEA